MNRFARHAAPRAARHHAWMKWIRLVGLLGVAWPLVIAGPARAQLGVSDDRVSLPEGPGSLEGIGENVDVAANMGQMSYQVLIEVPAGFAGLTPELALSYSSGNGSSALGIGWDLTIPTIERMTWRGLPEYQTDDLFAVNGSEQLVEVEQRGGERIYRARFEHGFVRYRWIDSGDDRAGYWIAEYPDGRVGYFGADRHGNEVASARVTGSAGEVFRYHLVEVTDLFGHHIDYRYRLWDNQALIDRIEYVHDAGDEARFAVHFGYEARQDVLSDASAGFELLLAQRLVSIDVLSEATRIRRYELAYEPYEAAGGLSRLAGVDLLGHLDERYPIRHTFGYSEALGGVCDGRDCAQPFVVDMGTLPGGADIATGDVNLIDINGDALPDVLDTSQPGAHRFILNVLESEGRSRFDTRVIASAVGTQGSHRLRSATVQALDVNGDGFSDLINSFTGEVLCNDASGDWSPDGTGPTGVPCLADGSQSLQLQEDQPGDPEPRHVRFIDIDNDKYIDVVRTPDNSPGTQIFRNTGAGFVSMESGVEPLGWVFDGDNLQLADMNGDGLLDVVQLDPGGGIHHRINLGLGAWGPIVDASGVALQISEIPLAQIEDINGDALADVVIAAGSELRYALNRNAGRFDDFVTITPAQIPDLPARGPQTTVVIADMNGNGTQDVVWIGSDQDRGHVRYLELFPVRPNLLSRIENGIGSVQVIEYGTSVAQQARDRDAGEAWKYRLPHGMNVVERVDTFATATGGEDGAGLHEVVEYRYRHGFYDSAEKRFRGFERAESRLLADASQEPALTVSEYDVGVEDTYFNGLLRSQTVFGGLDDTGSPLQTQRMEYAECEVAEVPASGLAFPVRSICMAGETTILQEGAGPDDWATLRTEYDHDGYGNAVSVRNLGVVHRGPPEAPRACRPCERDASSFGEACGATCQGDEAFADTDYITPGVATGGRWILGAAFRTRQYGVAGGDTSDVTTYYDGPAFVGLPAGQLDKGLVSRVEARVRAGSDETIALTRNRHDSHGNVVEIIDPNGALERPDTHRRVRVYDALGLNLHRTEILLEDEDGSPYRLRQEMSYEPLFNRVSESTATMRVVGGEVQSSRNSSFYRYDAFGRVRQLIRPGDSQDAPGLEATYDLAEPVSAIITRQRSQAGGDTDIESIRCIDGRGRVLQGRTRLADGSYQVTGFTEYNKRGAPVRVYEPYVDSSPACAIQPPGGAVRSTQLRYDALARNIETVLPDADIYGGPSRQRIVFAPLATLQYDPEDNAPESPQFDTPVVHRTDGLGRLVAIERRLAATGAPPTIELHYDGLGRLYGYRDPAGNRKIQQYDLLGRVLGVDDPNAGKTSYEYDAAGNLVVHRDARGVVVRSRYDGANRPLARWDEADPEGTQIRYRYDRADICSAQRCTSVEGKLAEVLYPIELGDGPTIGRDQFGFDARGRPVYQARVLFGHELPIERGFDNADRLVRAVYPDGQELTHAYDGASRLVGIDGVLDRVVYDARGQIERIDHRNGTSTWHGYDGIMRLSELMTLDSDGQMLQGFAYERDRAGNIQTIADLAAQRPDAIDTSAAFSYDPWYRLLTAKLGGGPDGEPEVLDYRYDDIDNVLSATSSLDAASAAHVGAYVYDSTRPNAVVQAGGQRRAYDAAGQLIERGGQHLAWDHLGRLAGAENASGVPVAHFAYGADQERVAKREADTLTLYIAPEFEVRDGISVLYARMGRQRVARLQSDALATTLLSDLAPLDSAGDSRPDGQINAADAWIAARAGEAASTEGTVPHSAPEALLRSSARRLLMAADAGTVFLHGDHLGSLTAATSEQGQLTGRRSYDVTGELRRASGYVDQYGFTGQARDESTGLLHFQFRYLDTDTGRWLSPDPLFAVLSPATATRLGESTVAYGYVANNPANYIDPTGLHSATLGFFGHSDKGPPQRADESGWAFAAVSHQFGSESYNKFAGTGTYSNFQLDTFLRFVREADEIHFVLNGMDVERFASSLEAPSTQLGNITNFELGAIFAAPELLKKTTFHVVDMKFDKSQKPENIDGHDLYTQPKSASMSSASGADMIAGKKPGRSANKAQKRAHSLKKAYDNHHSPKKTKKTN
jgi:RHS repeat-associated protein